MALTYQHIVHRINERNRSAKDRLIVEEIEHYAKPLFYLVSIFVSAFFLWIATADYRDVWQLKTNTLHDKLHYKHISKLMSRCANEEVVAFDNLLLKCDRMQSWGE